MSGPDRTGRAATTYRGVRWQRNTAGRLRWYNDDGDRWVLYRPGQDAPPRPPQWVGTDEVEPVGTPLRDRRARKGWRSPYRLAPAILIAVVIVIAVVQATTRHGTTPLSPTQVEKAAAQKLLGKCLVAENAAGGQLRVQAQPVSCSSPEASAKVVDVLPGTPGSPACAAGTTTIRLSYAGVAHPHQICVKRLSA